ncbi:uncharacterized protein LOC117060635 [Lacerta agilis]|uniref:uncharacterized protein LOC117060635 n=1 Tax=Lacerta agilis TaxID=80427 RepID=UPI001419A411|nr:uncharacterized protein LOC117060635 [Lacerta agilis]
MTSVEEKKRRRRKRRKMYQSGNFMAVDSCDLLNPGGKSDDIERLAHKYMQKCTVEYSSESESDADMEVLPKSVLLTRSRERTKLQFVDPYDGDDEEISGSLEQSRVIFLKHLSTEDSVLSEGPEPLSAFSPMEVPLIVTCEDEPQLYEAGEVLQMTTEPSWFPGPGHSKHAVLSEKAPCDFVLHPMLADCDNLRELVNVKRKQVRVVLDSTGETPRKKLRAT